MDGGGTILIVEDDSDVTETFARMLRMSGYRVVTALDVESGWREMAAVRPDAVLLDLRLPCLDGLAFLRRLRQHEVEHRTPVAIVTGDYFIDDNVARELRDLNAAIYFKPLWLEDLVDITARLLRGRR